MGLFAPGVWQGFNQSQVIDRERAIEAQNAAAKKQAMDFQALQMEEARTQQAQRLRTEQQGGAALRGAYGGPPPVNNAPAPAPAPGQNSAPQPPMAQMPQGQQGMAGPPAPMPQGQPQGGPPAAPMPQGPQAGPAPVPPYRSLAAAQQPPAQPAQPPAPGGPPPVGAAPEQAQGQPQRMSVQSIVQSAIKGGASDEEIARTVSSMHPFMQDQMREELAQNKMQLGQAQGVMKTLELALAQSKAAQTAQHQSAMEAQGQQRIGLMEKRIGQMGAAGGAPADKGGFEKLSPDEKRTVDFYAKQSLGGDNSWQVGLARGKVGQQLIQRVKDRIPQLAEETGQTAQDVAGTKAEMGALTKTLNDRVKYSTAVEQLQGTLTKQADLVESLIEKGASGAGSPVLNKWLQAGRKATGDPDVRAFNAAITGLSREHQRVLTSPLSNAQLHASAADTADKLINTADTPDAIRALIKVMRTEAANGKKQAQETVAEVKNKIAGLGKGKAKGDDAPAMSLDEYLKSKGH